VRFISQIVTEVRKREQAIEKVPNLWSFDEFVFLPGVHDEPVLADLSGELFRIQPKRVFVWIPEPDLGPPIHRTVVWTPGPLAFGPPVYEIEIQLPEPPEPPAPVPTAPEEIPALPAGPKWHSHVRHQYDKLKAVLLSNNELWCLQCASSIPHVQLALDGGPKGKDVLITKELYAKMDWLPRWCELCLMDIK
jgi:hypothetical protein